MYVFIFLYFLILTLLTIPTGILNLNINKFFVYFFLSDVYSAQQRRKFETDKERKLYVIEWQAVQLFSLLYFEATTFFIFHVKILPIGFF